MYAIYFPAPPLRQFIECWWFIKADLEPPAKLEEHIFADARADIVINFGSPYLRATSGPSNEPRIMAASNLDAQRRYPVSILQQGRINIVGIRFRPGGLAAFLSMPVAELDGLTLDLHQAFGPSGITLEQALYAASGDHATQVALLNAFFLHLLTPRDEHTLVAHIASTIEQHHGNITVQSLGDLYGYSIRTLDRRFQQIVGFSPKLYARMVRFRQALSCLVNDPAASWAHLVATYGYYDQPHFVKDFVEFTGTQPTAYRALLENDGVTSAPNYVQFLQE